jgi:Protein of unknown function (DUF3105)
MANRPDRSPDEAVAQPASPSQVGWRRTIQSLHGFAIITALSLALVVLLLVLAGNVIGFLQHPGPLLGHYIPYESSTHVPDRALEPGPALTPAGGPHYSRPLAVGVYAARVPDGNAVHSLEHGIVWITYQPDQITDAELDTLKHIASQFEADTILSPRPENSSPIIIVSWERRLTQTRLDPLPLHNFVETNRNRAPEPGVR